MSSFHLHIFDYNYSSWSMRPGVLLRAIGVPFEESRVHLDAQGKFRAAGVSPTGLLPALVHDGVTIWDSLAIAEYLAEQFPDRALWPSERVARALARSASAEMHSGFQAMRSSMNMNIRARYRGFARSSEVERDVLRVKALWTELRARFGGSGAFLCGEFGIVDAMFAPVVMRFRSYDVKLDGVCAAYADAVIAHGAVQSWLAEAAKETFVQPGYEYHVD